MRQCCDGECNQGRDCPTRKGAKSWIRENLWFDRLIAFCFAVMAATAAVAIVYLMLMTFRRF